MSLRDRIQRDATRVFLREKHFAEQVVYYPGGDRTKGRTILAVVDRNPPRRVDPAAPKGRDFGYSITIDVANDPEQGIDARTYSQQMDEVAIPVAGPGGDLVVRKFYRTPLSVDAGMIKLGVV